MTPPALILAATIAAFAALYYKLSGIGFRPKGYPPGPPTLPLIGNLHLMPKEKTYLQLQKWAKEYGPIYSLILGTKVMIVLSSDKTINDLLDKRSGIYSSRPEMYLTSMIGGDSRMLLMTYGERWRKIRSLVHNSLNIRAARAYVPYQDLENKAMLLGFLETPSQFIDHIRRYTNSLTTQMVFGFRTTSIDDPKLKQLFDGFAKFGRVAGSTTAGLVDFFPILRHLPDALLPLRRYVKELHQKESKLYVGHYLDTKKKLHEGTAKPCFCVDIVRAQEKYGLSDLLCGYTSGSMLEAGSDTTAATLEGFMQAVVIFPEVVKIAQEELDRVCGDRIPDLNDLPDLPYIRGCMKESLRWMPTVITGFPHAVIQDDEYMGYTIPKGASVVWNVWTVNNDPNRHPDPRRFDPARWAHDSQTSAEAANNRDPTKRDHFVFGAGRRLCQGMHIADRSLFLAMSRILWAFDLKRPIDPTTGQEIIPDMDDISEGIFVQPNPFGAVITPRNEHKAQRVRDEWKGMTELLDDEMQWKTVPEGLVWRDYEPLEAQGVKS
ncbi:cytochrome P450 [Biscogniauxia sp. FL1348]|nr:cytochrome P450 [Biscogniauxia sp. FL1348]